MENNSSSFPQSTDRVSARNKNKIIFISDLSDRHLVRSSFLIKQKEVLVNKNGKPYMSLLLGDKTGDIDARVWEDAELMAENFSVGDVVAVNGKTSLFHDRLQLIVQHAARIPSDEVVIEDFLPSIEADLDGLYTSLVAHFERLTNSWVRQLGLRLLNDPEIASRYKICPAAKTIHHAYIGGLLAHSLQLIDVVEALLPHYPSLDRDLLVFGAAFHDFGKIFELSYAGAFGYTDEGRLVGHIATGVALIDRKIVELVGFPKELEWQVKHLILSHHGQLQFGSPKEPATLEAEFLHCIDYMDSRLDSILALIKSDRGKSRWTPFHKAYGRAYYKPDKLMVKDSTHTQPIGYDSTLAEG